MMIIIRWTCKHDENKNFNNDINTNLLPSPTGDDILLFKTYPPRLTDQDQLEPKHFVQSKSLNRNLARQKRATLKATAGEHLNSIDLNFP